MDVEIVRSPVWITLGLATVLTTPTTAEEIVRCTAEPTSQWMSEAQMRVLMLERGYRIDVFKRTAGGCYEIYGRRAGKRVEAYFHPVTGDLVRSSD